MPVDFSWQFFWLFVILIYKNSNIFIFYAYHSIKIQYTALLIAQISLRWSNHLIAFSLSHRNSCQLSFWSEFCWHCWFCILVFEDDQIISLHFHWIAILIRILFTLLIAHIYRGAHAYGDLGKCPRHVLGPSLLQITWWGHSNLWLSNCVVYQGWRKVRKSGGHSVLQGH